MCVGGLLAAVLGLASAEEAKAPELPSVVQRPLERIQEANKELKALEEDYYKSYQRSLITRYARCLKDREKQIDALKEAIERLTSPHDRQLARLERDYKRLNERLERASGTREESILEDMDKLSKAMAACRDAVTQLKAPLTKIEAQKKDEVRPEFDEALGRPVPRLRLGTLDGKSVSLSDYCGKKAVLLYIWSRDNRNSRLELPRIIGVAGKLDQERTALVTIAIEERRPESPLQDYLKEQKYDALVLVDSRDATDRALDVRRLPAVYLVDAKGDLRWKVSGRISGEALAQLQRRLHWVLGDKPPAAGGQGVAKDGADDAGKGKDGEETH